MNILLPGGAGYIGSQLRGHLLAAGHRICILDPGWFGCKPLEHVNVRKVEKAEDIPDNIDAVVYLAGLTNDSQCEKKPDLAVTSNITAFEKLLWMAKDIRPFIFLSSAAAYGNSKDVFLEKDPLAPTTVYGEHKKFCENMLQKLDVSILRPAGVFGVSSRMRFDLTVNRMVRDAFKQGKIFVHGGVQWRPHVHIRDLIDAILFFLQTGRTGTYNIAYDNQTILETAERVRKIIPCEIVLQDRQDNRSYKVSFKKLERLGMVCGRTVESGARELLAQFKAGHWKDAYSDESMNVPQL